MTYILSYLLWSCLLFALFYITGCVVDWLILSRVGSVGADGLTRITLGMTFWMAFLFAVAALGLLYSLTIALAAFGAVAAFGVLAIRSGKQTIAPRLGRFCSPPRSHLLFLAPLVVMLIVLFVLALSPKVIGWDADTYHLTVPKLYIAHHGFCRIPFNVYSNWPLNIELLYGLAMLLKDYVLAKVLHFGFAVLTIVALCKCCAHHGRALAGLIAAALFLANGVVLQEIPIAYVDIAVAFFLLMAFVFVMRYLDTSRPLHLVMAGLCCGVLAGIKLTGVFGLVCMAALYVVDALAKRRPLKRCCASAVLLVVPFMALAGPWYIRSWLLTGNPVYPFLYDYFGGPEWNVELSRQLMDWQRSIGMGRSIVDYALLPFRVILKGGMGYESFDGRISPAWIVLIPLSVVLGMKDKLARRALFVALVYFVMWALSSQQMRLLIPVLPLLAIAAGSAIVRLLELVGAGRRVWLTDLVAVGCGLLLWTGRPQMAIAGYSLAADLFRRGGDISRTSANPIYNVIKEKTPPTAKLMFLNTNHGFFCDREYIADSFFEASQMGVLLRPAQSPAQIKAVLGDLDLTHILISSRNWGIAYPQALVAFLSNPANVSPVAVVQSRKAVPSRKHILYELLYARPSQPSQAR